MTGSRNAPPAQADYEAIEAAVMETARGRWFLAEYARRYRAADTTAVLEAIGRLEAILTALREPEAATAPGDEPAAHRDQPAGTVDAPAAPADLDLTELARHFLRGDPAADWAEWETLAAEDAADKEAAAADRAGDEAATADAADNDFAADDLRPAEPAKSATTEPEPLIAPAPAAAPVPEIFRTLREPTPLETVSPPPEAKLLTPGRHETPPSTEPASTAELQRPVEKTPTPVVRPRPPVRRPAPPKKPDPERYRPGPRIDDPTLTMTRDKKLALFS